MVLLKKKNSLMNNANKLAYGKEQNRYRMMSD